MMKIDADALAKLSLEEKRELARRLLQDKRAKTADSRSELATDPPEYTTQTYDMFLQSTSPEPAEMERFSNWVRAASADDAYTFEAARLGHQGPEVTLRRESGRQLPCVNLSSYHYLGLGYHPDVITAAKAALDRYGLGAGSSPVISGTFDLHKALEAKLVAFFGLPDRAISLFSSGYAVNTGAISAFLKPGQYAILDRSVHMSILEGAQLSRATIRYFRHNDPGSLERILQGLAPKNTRMLVCLEGVYSADGDKGKLAELVAVAKRYGAFVLVDEAHSVLVAGENGRGVAEEQDVLEDVDLYVMTFSKALGGVGGALLAKKEVAQYVNWYAKCRLFSCALDPAVAGGVLEALEIAMGPEGARRRARLQHNARLFRGLLKNHVQLVSDESWIVPVLFGPEKLTLPINDYLQRHGLDGSVMQFPAVAKDEARIRLFVTSEHTEPQLRRAANVIISAAEHFGFRLQN